MTLAAVRSALGTVAGALAGTRRRVVLTVILVLGGTIGGAVGLGVLGAPSVAAVDNSFGDVSEEETIVETDVVVYNPNPIGASVDDVTIDYVAAMDDVVLATGEKHGVALERGNTTLAFESHLRNDRIPDWWVGHLQRGEQSTLTVDATVHSGTLNRSTTTTVTERPVETEIDAAFDSNETRPIEAGQPLVDDPIAYVNQTRGSWGTVTEQETPADLELLVHNPKEYPLTISRIEYEVRMNDVAVGEGVTDEEYLIGPRSSERVGTTAIIDNQRLDDWWVTHLEQEQRTDVEIEFHAVIETGLDGSTVTVPLDTMETTIETDIFDEGDGERENSEETVTPTPDGTPTETAESDATATPTETPGSDDSTTATETPTPTDSPITGDDDEDEDDGILFAAESAAVADRV